MYLVWLPDCKWKIKNEISLRYFFHDDMEVWLEHWFSRLPAISERIATREGFLYGQMQLLRNNYIESENLVTWTINVVIFQIFIFIKCLLRKDSKSFYFQMEIIRSHLFRRMEYLLIIRQIYTVWKFLLQSYFLSVIEILNLNQYII